MEAFDIFEAHYYFNDSSHCIDSVLRNKCEAEILAIIQEASLVLDIDATILSEAFREGGFRDKWKLLGKNANQITLILTIITTLLTIKTTLFDTENQNLEKELIELQIEETKLNVEKLKKELKKDEISSSTIKKATNHLSKNLKIIKRKSNFYSEISQYEKISKVGFSASHIQSINQEEKIVLRENFHDHILKTNKISTIETEAEIEIISPVLKEGNYKWKGIYEKKPISFKMSDDSFKDLVLVQNIPFQHGTKILCVLRIKRELDEVGEIKISGYTVSTVIEKIDPNSKIETTSGKKYRHDKKQASTQGVLFS